jgi:sugar phosphate isomerase/epimerase
MKYMKIGFPNHPRMDVLEEIEWIGKNGFDFVDLFLEADRAGPEAIEADNVLGLLQKYGLGIVGHMPWYLPIGSPDSPYREFAVKEAKRYFEVFSRLDVRYVTVHANWPPRLFSIQEGISFQISTLKNLVREAQQYSINLVYEPMDTAKDTLENVTRVLHGAHGLYLHIDIGHANLFGRKPEQFIKTFFSQLKHVHMHDNDGNRDLHLPIGEGTIDWKNLIKVLKEYYDGTITLEIFSQDRNHVLASKDRLKELWGA